MRGLRRDSPHRWYSVRSVTLILMLTMLVSVSVLPAQTLSEVLQTLETSLDKLEQGYTLVNSGLKTLREQQTQLSVDLDTLERASTELERRQDSLEQSWSEQKESIGALDAALSAEISDLQTELWVYRVGLAVAAGLIVWSLVK